MRSAAVHQCDRQTEVRRTAGEAHKSDHSPSEQIHGLQVRYRENHTEQNSNYFCLILVIKNERGDG